MAPSNSQDKIAELKDFFNEYIFGFIYHDINAAICGKANYLAALGLLAYTEFLGKLVKGGGEGSEQFYEFLHNDMGTEYQKLKRQVDVYVVFRHGLAHQYFIKKRPSVVVMFNRPPQPCGIVKIKGQWVFIVEKYYEDFKAGVAKYYNELVVKQNQKLIQNFERVMKSVKP